MSCQHFVPGCGRRSCIRFGTGKSGIFFVPKRAEKIICQIETFLASGKKNIYATKKIR
jgi:hypothetical protein